MTTESKKNFVFVILCFAGVCFIVVSNFLIEFNIVDGLYLLFVIIVLFKYIRIKKAE